MVNSKNNRFINRTKSIRLQPQKDIKFRSPQCKPSNIINEGVNFIKSSSPIKIVQNDCAVVKLFKIIKVNFLLYSDFF